MATTITQDDINAVAQQVLTLIRDSGREFNNNPITFKDPFNVTEEEREGIRIPAIDERTAGQSKTGTLDLEGLLTAYGLSEVENIANTMSTSYMKKVADSNLNMNGHNIEDVKRISSPTYSTTTRLNIYPIPKYTYSQLGANSQYVVDFIQKWLAKVAQEIASSGVYIAEVQPSTTGVIILHMYAASIVSSTGLPSYCSGIYFSYSDDMILRFYTKNGELFTDNISTFPRGDTTKNNRINAFGSNSDGYYLQLENGLQICWGRFSKELSLTSTNTDYAINHNFAGAFVNANDVFVSVTTVGTLDIQIYRTNNSASAITKLALARPNARTEVCNFRYIAIGKWK